MIPEANIKVLALAIEAVKDRRGAIDKEPAAYRREIEKTYKQFVGLLPGGLLDNSET